MKITRAMLDRMSVRDSCFDLLVPPSQENFEALLAVARAAMEIVENAGEFRGKYATVPYVLQNLVDLFDLGGTMNLRTDAKRLEEIKKQCDCAHLKSDLEGANDCLDMVRKKLVALGCAHGAEKHESTPPMFFPEWIECVVARAIANAAGKEARNG